MDVISCQLSKAVFLLAMAFSIIVAQTMDELITTAMDQDASTDYQMFEERTNEETALRLTELDMVLSSLQYTSLYDKRKRRKKRKAIADESKQWTLGIIPYSIAPGVFTSIEKEEIDRAMKEWALYTCLAFPEADPETKDRILFSNGVGCSSRVGKSGGAQDIKLGKGCRIKRIIVHEIGHAVGFYHEMNRPDRDDHIMVFEENIKPDMFSQNFRKYSDEEVRTYGIPYDYESVMHYGKNYFTKNGLATLQTKDRRYQNTIGNATGLSFRDIKLANLMYSCHSHCPLKKTCPGEGFLGETCDCWCPGTPVVDCDSKEPISNYIDWNRIVCLCIFLIVLVLAIVFCLKRHMQRIGFRPLAQAPDSGFRYGTHWE